MGSNIEVLSPTLHASFFVLASSLFFFKNSAGRSFNPSSICSIFCLASASLHLPYLLNDVAHDLYAGMWSHHKPLFVLPSELGVIVFNSLS